MNFIPESFEFESYRFEPHRKEARFYYTMHFKDKEPLSFVETIGLPRVPNLKKVPAGLLKELLASLHIILGISYYKLYCPKKVVLSYKLTADQAKFWTAIYQKGLGELAYREGLDPRKLAQFPSQKVRKSCFSLPRQERSLLGIGGGKDSIVAGELLKGYGKKFDAVTIETQKSSTVVHDVIKTMDVNSVILKRSLDPRVLDVHEGAYNGHIPISAVFAFLGFFAAVLYDYRFVVVANEQSSNFGNLRYKGGMINHQWSKSTEFEELFQDYARQYLTPDIRFFSLLRPFYEIRIAEMFSKYRDYFKKFTSCNRSFRIQKNRSHALWCGACAKCVFVFILLSAFVSKKELLDIFGKNLYEESALLPVFKDVLGLGKTKPFDCVGTFEEAQVAFEKASEHHGQGHEGYGKSWIMKKLSPLLKVTSAQKKQVFQTTLAPTMPSAFRFLGMKDVMLLGYGKEGHATEKYLKKNFKKLRIRIADRSFDSHYLEEQNDTDFVIKTPGIPKAVVIRPYTTASNLFLEEIRMRPDCFTIGITGSKGKSTTSSLIAQILRKAGKPVQLLGNIGNPMLNALLKPIPRGTIFVLELSSYQLDDLEYSPHIAVVTNLFPEHMNYHGDLESYYEAKKNITAFQGSDDFFVYNPRNTELKKWLPCSRGKALPFIKELPLRDKDIPLIGVHNHENVAAAITIARLLGVSDTNSIEAVKKFHTLPHRLEKVGTYRGITFYDDAISTAPDSTIMALQALKKVDTIFLGGEDRGYDFRELEKTLRSMNVRNLVLFPETGQRLLRSYEGFKVLQTESMEEAVRFAYQHTARGKICLLSCASPSYSLWESFEEKGGEFQKWVKRMA